ncbi:hypothetical protein AMK59_1437, partial [Oryctes borbonicus]
TLCYLKLRDSNSTYSLIFKIRKHILWKYCVTLSLNISDRFHIHLSIEKCLAAICHVLGHCKTGTLKHFLKFVLRFTNTGTGTASPFTANPFISKFETDLTNISINFPQRRVRCIDYIFDISEYSITDLLEQA